MRATTLALVVAVLAPSAAAAGEAVQLVLSFHLPEGPRYRDCSIEELSGPVTLMALLDEAMTQDCFSSWTHSPGRSGNVRAIDEMRGLDGWNVYVDGIPSHERIDTQEVQPGQRVQLVLDDPASILKLA